MPVLKVGQKKSRMQPGNILESILRSSFMALRPEVNDIKMLRGTEKQLRARIKIFLNAAGEGLFAFSQDRLHENAQIF